MWFEKYTRVFEKLDTRIKSGKSESFEFDWKGESPDRLFFAGETAVSYFWKSEPDYQQLYRRIDDSLSVEEAERDHYALDFSGDFAPYTKLAAKKLTSPLWLSYAPYGGYDNSWHFGIRVKAQELCVKGFLRVVLEIRYKKEGIDTHYALDEPDDLFTLNVPEGSYGWTELSSDVEIDMKNIASVYYIVEGEEYSGRVFFESPCLESCDKHNIISEFCPRVAGREHFNWFGQNLSKIEWQNLKIDINGIEIFDGEVFERCHRMSEKEVRLPENILKEGKNLLTFTNKTSFREAPAYTLEEIGFITESRKTAFAVPENVTLDKPFSIFVDAKKGERFELVSDCIHPVSELVAKRDGISALTLVCTRLGHDIEFTLNNDVYTISRCVMHGDDGVMTGTGDAVYINANREDLTNYIKWYLSSNIGRFFTLRPTYRWCGTRVLDEKLWREVADVLSEGGVYFAHMVDGRELPGCNANPSVKALESEYFLGRQSHELDGQHAYWGIRDFTANLHDEMFYDMFARMIKRFPDNTPCRYSDEFLFYENGRRTVFNTSVPTDDMKIASERFVESVRRGCHGNSRHTGPTTLFKYFYQAGYETVGAELMYSPSEICSAALRGARSVYGNKVIAHHAVQWSTYPHDIEPRYRRYRLALFLSYIHEIDEINTEEGLWRLEQYYAPFNRFSAPCLAHKKEQQDLEHFISTHTRTGKFYTPVAFLSGRYDGWECFARYTNTWGIDGFGTRSPEKAWDILKVFYPRSVLDKFYIMNCPDVSQGFYTGTPYGNVDIMPIEADSFENYGLVVAVGYNKAEADDLDKLYRFVEKGGRLVMGLPQFSLTTKRCDVVSCNHEYISHPLAPNIKGFFEDSFEGEMVSVADVEAECVRLSTDNGRPLVIERRIGKGSLILINAREWADSPAVYKAYKRVLCEETEKCIANESVWARGDENVQFAVYNNPDGTRNVYFIATDWYSENRDGEGLLLVGGREYKIKVPFGTLIKVAATDNASVYPLNDECEVVSISDTEALVQGVGVCDFAVMRDGIAKNVTVDFDKNPVAKINI